MIVKLCAAFALLVVVVVTVIKVVQGCSYKDAVGIAGELVKEMRESCCRCCAKSSGDSCGEPDSEA